MQTEQHRIPGYIGPYLFMQILLSGISFVIEPIGVISFSIPLLFALLPLPGYCVPSFSEAAAKTFLCAAGAALLCAVVIYAAYIGTIFGFAWVISGGG